MAFKTIGSGSFGNVYLAKAVKKTPFVPNGTNASVYSVARSGALSQSPSFHGQSLHGSSTHSYASGITSVSGQSVASEIETTDRVAHISLIESLRQQEEDEFVAIKKVYQNKKSKNRELEIMRQLHKHPHPYIVHMKHYFITKGKRLDDTYLNLVLEYVPETLAAVIEMRRSRKEVLPNLLVKLYTYQLLRGLAHLHGLSITHRDVKPSNLLIDPLRHRLKICDFGSAKTNIEREGNVAYMCTRYYRAPELVLGCTHYTTAIDIWSAGCVLAEMLSGAPFFPGKNAADQMIAIAKVMGTPTRDELISMSPPSAPIGCSDQSLDQSLDPAPKHIEFFSHMAMPVMKPRPLNQVLPSATLGTISLLERLLKYSPNQRPNAIDACAHYNFEELRSPKTLLPVVTAQDYSPVAKGESASSAKITRDMIANAISISTALGPIPLPTEMFEFTEEELSLASSQTLETLINIDELHDT
jgi:serine/threonine protein kinase